MEQRLRSRVGGNEQNGKKQARNSHDDLLADAFCAPRCK